MCYFVLFELKNRYFKNYFVVLFLKSEVIFSNSFKKYRSYRKANFDKLAIDHSY